MTIKTNEAAIALLESNEGKNRRSNLFKKLSGMSIGDVLRPLGLDRFVTDWNALAEIRNNVGHGNFFSSPLDEADEIELLKRVYSDCIPVFAALHNHARASAPSRP